MKKISILGVTGSIGKSSLKILDNFPDDLKLISISANKNIKELLKIVEKYRPGYAVITDNSELKNYFGKYEIEHQGIKIFSGLDGLKKICSDKDNDIIINGISGKAGLMPSVTILENRINLALANKESIVCAGPILKELAKKNSVEIIPVDSEHSAIFHLLKERAKKDIKYIYLTASGGPFLKLSKNKWGRITIEDALNHPTWKMGSKITIDSSTMANKGLEVIEAHFLFDMPYHDIKVLIHPESLIHSLIETNDREVYAQLGPNDMSIPVQNALFYPELKINNYNALDFTKTFSLHLEPVDFEKFKMLEFAYYCGKKEGLFPAFYNFVNETLVHLFLDDQISFLDIERYTETSIIEFEKDNTLSKNVINMDSIKEVEYKADEILKNFIKI